jgi:hypothetical protein
MSINQNSRSVYFTAGTAIRKRKKWQDKAMVSALMHHLEASFRRIGSFSASAPTRSIAMASAPVNRSEAQHWLQSKCIIHKHRYTKQKHSDGFSANASFINKAMASARAYIAET